MVSASVVGVSLLLVGVGVYALGMGDMVAKGTWAVLNIQRCENYENYVIDFDVRRKKINRTHDVFDAYLNLEEAFGKDVSLHVDICKFVEGGCKPYQVIADDSVCGFARKYAEENMEAALSGIGLDPPDCPIPSGNYKIEDFLFNYEELPEDGLPGRFIATAVMSKEGVDLSCVSMTVEFTEKDED